MKFELPEKINAGDQVEIVIAPRGSWPQLVDGKEIIQVVDDKAVKSLVDTFDGEVLVDADHKSESGDTTEAMAWVTKLVDVDGRGLVAVLKFTDKGADAVSNRRYRFYSPAWTLDADNRPVKLVSVGLTNKPNLPVAPILNMRVVNAAAEAGAVSTADDEGGKAAKAVDNDGNPQPSEVGTKGDPNMDRIKQALGLPPEATDEEVLTAIEALKAASGTAKDATTAVNEALGLEPTATNEDALEAINALKTQCGDLQQAQNEAKADEFVKANADMAQTPEEQAELKNAYLADPEQAATTVANARRFAERVIANAQTGAPKEEPKKVINAEAAKKPVVCNSVFEGLKACKTVAEEQAYIREHAHEFHC